MAESVILPPMPLLSHRPTHAARRRRDCCSPRRCPDRPSRARPSPSTDYAARRKIHELQHDAAGLERTGARDVVAGRSILVSQHERDRQRILPRRCGERHEGAGVQSRRRRRRADDRDGQAGRRDAVAVHADHVRRRQPVVLVRQRRQAMDLRCAGQAVHVGRSARAGAEQRAVARRQVRRLHQGLQPVGSRHRRPAPTSS